MRFNALHENLRLEILRRIERGVLSGATLARATGFQQAHISNFLNRKRSLSLEGLDRVLAAQNLSILDLLPADAFPFPSLHDRAASLTQTVAVVTHAAAAVSPRIQPTEILETVEVPDTILHFSRERPTVGKTFWHRFVAVRADALHAAAMKPLLRQNDIAVIDRHYNSLALYRSQAPSIYAVHAADTLHLCFLEFDASRLVLRPRNRHVPVRLLELLPSEQPADRIVGRVCYVLSEL
ncbi:MAG: helix-turn-helix transcriptional regulator [Acidobacteriaceae bacterium]